MALVIGVKKEKSLSKQSDIGLVNLPKTIVSHQFDQTNINAFGCLFGLIIPVPRAVDVLGFKHLLSPTIVNAHFHGYEAFQIRTV
jgi:hypothetical protein